MITRPRLRLSRQTINSWLPPVDQGAFAWICENAVTKRGEPFDRYSYPWTEGICASWDDPTCERIFFQAGSRLGKTELGMALMLYSLARDPDIAMLGGPTKEKIEQWMGDRLVPMIEGCMVTRHWLPPEHKRKRTEIKLRHGTIYGAWSGSPTTLGDLDPRYLFGFEISKFTKAASEEADSLRLLLERGSEIPDRRVYCESTPTIYGKCRVNHYLRAGTNCRFWVPCPFCGGYQWLKKGKGRPDEGGLIWDRDSTTGHSTPQLAYATARYRCEHCGREFGEDKRLSAVEKGIWCPHGGYVNKRGRVVFSGTYGPDHTYQLSRLYGATFSFGAYARAYVDAKNSNDVEAIRSFLNNWEGIPWTSHYSMARWESIADRICTDDCEIGQCPDDTVFITVGVDVQVDHWVYAAVAWREGERGTLLTYGMCYSWQEIREVIESEYTTKSGQAKLMAIFTLVDARDGNRTDEVKSFCRSLNRETGPWVLPCMGANSAYVKRNYSKTQLDDQGKATKKNGRRGLAGFDLITVNTNYYQQWIHNCLDRRSPEEENSMTFPVSAKSDKDLFDQLLAEKPEWRITSTGEACYWVKDHDSQVNDLRDAIRYARCGADVFVANNWSRVRSGRRVSKATQPANVPPAPKPKPKESGPINVSGRMRPRWVRQFSR